MADWPNLRGGAAKRHYTTEGIQCPFAFPYKLHGAISTSTAWSAANRAVYMPMVIDAACIAKRMFWVNGTAVSGIVYIGLYYSSKNLIVQGSATATGTSTIQFVDTTDVTLLPGLYYIALAADNTTTTLLQQSVTNGASLLRTAGVQHQDGAVSGASLPDPAVFADANPATAAYPICGFSTSTLG